MPLSSKSALRLITLIVVALFSLTLGPGVDKAFADRRGKKDRVVVSPTAAGRGHVVKQIPPGHRKIRHRGKEYFYHGGVFYVTGPAGFIVVEAPIGAVVVSLAVGYNTLWVGGMSYYYYGGVFYQRVSAGFVVVESPPAVVVVAEPPVIVQPAEVTSGIVKVTALRLNVRTGPGLHHPIIQQVNMDETLTVHGIAPGWLYVEFVEGQYGWVMTEYTAPALPPASG